MIKTVYSLSEIKKLTESIFMANSVKTAGVFGSYANSTPSDKSDIDFVGEFNGCISLFQPGKIKDELETILGKECDVITLNSLQNDESDIAKEILGGIKIVYGEHKEHSA